MVEEEDRKTLYSPHQVSIPEFGVGSVTALVPAPRRDRTRASSQGMPSMRARGSVIVLFEPITNGRYNDFAPRSGSTKRSSSLREVAAGHSTMGDVKMSATFRRATAPPQVR